MLVYQILFFMKFKNVLRRIEGSTPHYIISKKENKDHKTESKIHVQCFELITKEIIFVLKKLLLNKKRGGNLTKLKV